MLSSSGSTHVFSRVSWWATISCGDGVNTVDEIEDRAKLHEGCDANSICDSFYYVGGFYCMDLIAWAMETNQAVYMIRRGSCEVEVFEPFKFPIAIELKNASPSKEDTVIDTRDSFESIHA